MAVEEEDFKRGGVEKVSRKRKVERDLFQVDLNLLHIKNHRLKRFENEKLPLLVKGLPICS